MRRAVAGVLRRLALPDPSLSGCVSIVRAISTYPALQQKRQANEVRPGNVLEVEGKLMLVLKSNHAHGNARQIGNVQLELRDLGSRSKHPLRLRPSDSVEVVRLEERTVTCLYLEAGSVHTMDPGTFEQVAVDAALFGAGAQFLGEGQALTLELHEGAVVGGRMPGAVTLNVAAVAPYMKGETQTPSYKPATLENGATVQVPPFVKPGDAVQVDPSTGAFLRRA